MTDFWRPAASWPALRYRAVLAAVTRSFFAERGVLEVDTPRLSAATVTDPHLASFAVPVATGRTLYLQTSPEYAMKRLLAAGSGPIYQLGPAFRDGEAGRRHNPEFTLLEWYRPGFDHHALMDEMDAFLAATLGSPPAERLTYRDLFLRHLDLDPHLASVAELDEAAASLSPPAFDPADRDGRLDLLVSHRIEPRLPLDRPTYVHDYPASQAALARLRVDHDGTPVAERFEVFAGGMELANGFHELADPVEQRHRFERDLAKRRALGLPEVPIDEHLLAALAAGLPDCAGVALGFDRLMMLAVGASSLAEVLAFPIDRA